MQRDGKRNPFHAYKSVAMKSNSIANSRRTNRPDSVISDSIISRGRSNKNFKKSQTATGSDSFREGSS
jgi:hypothetical protein